ncbi:AMP-binding protein [Shewanella sp. HL-SH8]|uniref:AMP-binding protein n=1 Tax=Shewanella sp. HL-SH8 TaxID=3436242 RepID=UPI003EB6DD3C
MFVIDEQFLLIEPGLQCCGIDFTPSADCKSKSFIELNGAADNATSPLVSKMIQAMVDAQQADIPVIFNRTNQDIDDSNLPTGFAIGLLTSGTTGQPKLVFHRLNKLMPKNANNTEKVASRWLLCYHPMSFAGLQVILQAIVSKDTLIADVDANLQHKAELAIKHSVNAISATPSMMRALLMSWHTKSPPLAVITLGGEIADQDTLDAIKLQCPRAKVRHIYATTEAGVIFSVKDGLAGFPRTWLKQKFNGWQLTATHALQLNRLNESIDTGDCIALTDDRVLFTGREDSLVNVGGVKVNLETLEQKIIALVGITDARVYAKANPITGALICVELCADDQQIAKEALKELAEQLEPGARPRIITFSEQISLSATGKKQRLIQ